MLSPLARILPSPRENLTNVHFQPQPQGLRRQGLYYRLNLTGPTLCTTTVSAQIPRESWLESRAHRHRFIKGVIGGVGIRLGVSKEETQSSSHQKYDIQPPFKLTGSVPRRRQRCAQKPNFSRAFGTRHLGEIKRYTSAMGRSSWSRHNG